MSQYTEQEAAATSNLNSHALYERALKVFPSGVTHDNRYFGEIEPIYIERAQGSRKWDVEGHEYIDYWMGHGALLLGHGHPAIVDAVQQQIMRGTHYGGSHPLEVEWGELIQRLVPSAERVKFTGSGTEATMMAVRLARACTGRQKFLKFEGHFHGWSDAMTAGFHAPFNVPSSVGVSQSVLESVIVAPNDLVEVERIFSENPDDIACAILEPTGASYGTIPLPEGFLAGLRDIVHRYGALLVFDEIVTGFRYTPGGVQQMVGVTPDLTALAKIVAGGLPGGAVVGKAEAMSALEFHPGDPNWNRYKRINHPGTFNANPLSAAAGIAMLNIASTGDAQEYISQLGYKLVAEMNKAISQLGIEGSCVYGDGPIFHVLLGKGASVNSNGTLVPGCVDILTLRQGNAPDVKAAMQRGMMRRGVDLMSGYAGIMATAHTGEDVALTATAFYETLKEMRESRLLV
ncbi:MAG TPA: aspartate aminotransferase family protein [Chloroflexia bacterium]|nr:aspartate aminotransferase family protein [Chloroflexia bacterium]